MKFRKIFQYEFNYQVVMLSTWIYFAVILVLSFLMTRDGSLSAALHTDLFINSPFVIAKTTVFGSLIWLLIAPGVAGAAAARDLEIRMHPLTYTMPISKVQYLGGRFAAALALNALILLAIPLGILCGVYLPGVHPENIGPFRLAAFGTAYCYISLANAFVATGIQFWLATRSGRPMSAYLGSVLLIFMGFFVASLLLFKWGLGTFLDPIGIRFIVEDVAHMWTSVEQNSRLIGLEGVILTNRLLWITIAAGVLTITFLRFRFAHRELHPGWLSKIRLALGHRRAASKELSSSTSIKVPIVSRNFGFVTHARQTLSIAVYSCRLIMTSWAGIALLVGIPLLTVPVVLDQMGYDGGVLLPITMRVINELTAPLSAELSRWVIIPAFIIFFAGELVWSERDARMAELTHAMPGSEWPPLLGKFLGISFIMTLFLVLLTIAGISAQMISNYHDLELDLYLKIMFGLQLPEYLLFIVLALVMHVVVDHKYTGHLVAVSAYVFMAMSSLFGIEHNLLVYGASPRWSYTEIRGFEPSIWPWFWFKLYWASWALLLALIAKLLWVRGHDSNLLARLRVARQRVRGFTIVGISISLGLIVGLGGFIFYNTNFLNKYLSASHKKEQQAEYERRYGKYEGAAQPQTAATKLYIEIYPDKKDIQIQGSYRLINTTGIKIDSIHLAIAAGVETGSASFDRPATLVMADQELGHRIYGLEQPLKPGDSVKVTFTVRANPHGFSESGVDGSVVANGTYFTNTWLPAIGYQRDRGLSNPADRKTYGLKPRPFIASLYDVDARRRSGGGKTTFEAIVGTKHDQIAIAPGELRRSWRQNGRRYFRYATNAPGNEWAFFSARYAVYNTTWKGRTSHPPVAIKIFHHPQHTAHLDRMVRSIHASLDYYTSQFGAYRHSQVSVVERPGNGTGMHTEAPMLSHGEGFTSWKPMTKAGSHDHPFAIVAHEMAHLWTVPYANVEGAPVMSESLAWYYAMKAVEKAKGKEHLRWLLSFMRQPHPIAPIRRGEPLLRGLDQYMSYRKGPFALYALSEYIGEEQVNRALHTLREKHRLKGAPLATTLDLFRELQSVTPDSIKYLLHDFFEVNTFWELKTNKVTAKKIEAGTWQVSIDVEVRKVVVDFAGVEKEVRMNDWIEIGVLEAEPARRRWSQPAYLKKHHFTSGKQRVILTVSKEPGLVGIDPNHLLIDLKTGDNIRQAKIQ